MSESHIPCPPLCPGCHYPRHPYEKIADEKFERATALFSSSGHALMPYIPAPPEHRLHYRRKSVLHAEFRESRWHFGLMKNDEVMDISGCAIHSGIINRCVEIFAKFLPQDSSFPLKYYVHSGSQIVLVLKTNAKQDFSWLGSDCVNELEAAGAEGLWVHYNASAGKRIFLKDKLTLLWGSPVSADESGLRYGPLSFTQQIRPLAEKALELALSHFDCDRISERVVDLYCGTGRGIMRFSRCGFTCIGVELSGEAVQMTLLNNPGATVLRGKCHERIPQVNEWLGDGAIEGSCWNLYVNPPRTGLDTILLEWICALKPRRLAYLSCSPHTLLRDLNQLEAAGYSADLLQPFDFFPYTRHTEILALLSV